MKIDTSDIIINTCCNYYNYNREFLITKNHSRETKFLKQRSIIMYSLFEFCNVKGFNYNKYITKPLSLTEIGIKTGAKHYSTVLHHKNKIKGLLQLKHEKEFINEINDLFMLIKFNIENLKNMNLTLLGQHNKIDLYFDETKYYIINRNNQSILTISQTVFNTINQILENRKNEFTKFKIT